MKKKYKDYFDKYGDVEENYLDRFHSMMSELKFSNKDMGKLRELIPKFLYRKWNKMDFTFYMIPKPTSRPRTTSFHKRFYVKDASDNNELFKTFIEECTDINFTVTTPTKLYCDIFLPTPTGMNKFEKILSELKLIYAISRPDWDNLGKTYSDMIQGFFLLDDSLIVDGNVRKFYSTKPRIEIHLEFMDEYDCKFNKRKIENWKTVEPLKDRIFDRDSLI